MKKLGARCEVHTAMLHVHPELLRFIIRREVVVLAGLVCMITSTMFEAVIVDGGMNGLREYGHIIEAGITGILSLVLLGLVVAQ